jgi:hypothetical protein
LVISIKRTADVLIDGGSGAYGVSCEIFGFNNDLARNFKLYVSAIDRNNAEIWLYTPSSYHHGNYMVTGFFNNWVDAGGSRFTYDEPTANLQDVIYYDMTQAGTRR